jgi:hypothetical protein
MPTIFCTRAEARPVSAIRQPLAVIYGWVAAGFDTANPREAEMLLEGLS